MALPWDPTTGAYVPPGPLSSPIQNPLDPRNQAATVAAMANDREKRAALERAMMRAAALREEPLNAQGPGPLGVRQGVGPMGWAVSLADAVAGAIAEKRRKAATENVAGAQSEVAPATQEYVKNFLKGRPGGLYDTGYGLNHVAQGSPLSLSDF